MSLLRRLGLCLLLILAPLAAAAQTVPTPLSDHVSDFADLLEDAAEAQIDDLLARGRAETGVHIAVATIDRTADYGGPDRIEDFATAWFNAWGIGDPDRGDGILILVAAGDRVVRVALGAGYPVIYDGRAQRVIDTAMLPAFRTGDLAGGIEAGAAAALDLLARPFAAEAPLSDRPDAPVPVSEPAGGSKLPFVPLLVFAGAAAFVLRRRIGNAMVRLKRCPSCGRMSLRRTSSVLRPASRAVEGTGIEQTRCTSCSWHEDRRYPIARKSPGRSGGGFGGGRSSGGGATGRW